MPRTETSGAWLDDALTENLSVVPAPSELWDRVRMPGPVTARSSIPPRRWGLAMASTFAVLVAAGLWSFGKHESGSREFGSHDAVAMRAWVKDRTGLDIPLVAGGTPRVQLASARFRKGEHFWDGTLSTSGRATAEVAFFVENRRATLRVSAAGPASAGISQHNLLAGAPNRGSQAVSWVVRGQLYTLACASPEDLRIACSLCHGAGAL